MKTLILSILPLGFTFSLLLNLKTCLPEPTQSTTMKQVSSLPTPSATNVDSTQQLIVLSAPSIHNTYYQAVFGQIIDFLIHFAQQAAGKDELLILADAATLPYLKNDIPKHQLLEANIEDIWIRDFAPVLPNRQVKFRYAPSFQAVSTSQIIDRSFNDWAKAQGLSYGRQSTLILDGGNLVDNGNGRAVLTDRFLKDNPSLNLAQAKNQLKQLLQLQEVAIIPEIPGDATGHADGLLMWAMDNKILLHELPEPQRQQTIDALETAFPKVELVWMPDYYQEAQWRGFTSACNIFVNAVVTDQYIYAPTFGEPHDEDMLQLISQHSDKTVVPIAAQKVCFMGGSVRCLSWQVKGKAAQLLMDSSKNRP